MDDSSDLPAEVLRQLARRDHPSPRMWPYGALMMHAGEYEFVWCTSERGVIDHLYSVTRECGGDGLEADILEWRYRTHATGLTEDSRIVFNRIDMYHLAVEWWGPYAALTPDGWNPSWNDELADWRPRIYRDVDDSFEMRFVSALPCEIESFGTTERSAVPSRRLPLDT